MASRCGFASISFAAVALLLAFAAPAWTAQGLADDQSPVQRGEYLVQAANCVSCHTSTDGKAFAGGNAFETTYRFLGKIYSSNLTPDPETGLGSWSEDDFIRAMRNGVAPGGKYLFPAFPYTAFTKLSTADIKAIYAYLRTLPAVRFAPAKASFWFRQRWVMALWNWLFFKPGEAAHDPSQSDAWNRGSYLVEALGHCSACHTPRNLMFAERTDRHLTGGVEVAQVEDGKYRNWSAPNLTSAQSGLAQWSLDDLKKYLKTGYSRRAGALGPMNEVIANSLRHLNDSDIAAMAIYVQRSIDTLRGRVDHEGRDDFQTVLRRSRSALARLGITVSVCKLLERVIGAIAGVLQHRSLADG